ncbi:MAG: PilZ domain-containing protein [Dissulfurispiraceae bacterium]
MDSLPEIAQHLRKNDPESQLEIGRKVRKKQLLNILNYTNFQDGTIALYFKHLKYGNIISLQARPQPCHNDSVDCLWVQKDESVEKLCAYKFLNFVLSDGQEMVVVEAALNRINDEGVSFVLPEVSYEVSSRRVRRHPCEGIDVALIQNSVIFHGLLTSFSAISFRLEVSVTPPQTFQWINPELTVTVVFQRGDAILYTGECRIIRQTYGHKTRAFALEPLHHQINRFKPKEIRSPRFQLRPSPNIVFHHPIIKKTIILPTEDLSGTGFSVEEDYSQSVMLPGMIIPELFIEFASDLKIRCMAQVIYRNVYETATGAPLFLELSNQNSVKCGVAILDMEMQDQVRLSSLLHQATNKNSYVCSRIDLDSLMKFFFETGFFYPKKYVSIHNNKEEFKETYEKLYMHSPNIARHFIYQDKGVIHGHISMVRCYENTWLFHHHAATRSSNRAGLEVLNQISRYVNDFYSLYSTHLNFVMCYYSDDNKFPSRVFGGFADKLNDPRGCSIDPFVFITIQKTVKQMELPAAWTLTETQPQDLMELESFYEHLSGGLMPYALDLEPGMIDTGELCREFQKVGFKKDKHLFSLKKDGILRSVMTVNISDFGLNMSNLTNCIHVIVLDPDDFPRNVFYAALSRLSQYYELKDVNVLLYPVSYAESHSIPYDKIYNLWIISTQCTVPFIKHLENLFYRHSLYA